MTPVTQEIICTCKILWLCKILSSLISKLCHLFLVRCSPYCAPMVACIAYMHEYSLCIHLSALLLYIWLYVCVCVMYLSVCWKPVSAAHTCDVLWADLMERHCTIHISKNAWRCLWWCSSTATRAANSVTVYVYVHVLHSTNLIQPWLSFSAFLAATAAASVCCLTRRRLHSHQSDIWGFSRVRQDARVTPLLFSAN